MIKWMNKNFGISSNRKLNLKVGKLELYKEEYFEITKWNNINNNDSWSFWKLGFNDWSFGN